LTTKGKLIVNRNNGREKEGMPAQKEIQANEDCDFTKAAMNAGGVLDKNENISITPRKEGKTPERYLQGSEEGTSKRLALHLSVRRRGKTTGGNRVGRRGWNWTKTVVLPNGVSTGDRNAQRREGKRYP